MHLNILLLCDEFGSFRWFGEMSGSELGKESLQDWHHILSSYLPGFTEVTPSPTLSMIPAPSWPKTAGRGTWFLPSTMCRSVPQIPDDKI